MGEPPEFKCDMVIARFKETLPWLPIYARYKFRNIYVYNKNQNENDKTSKDLNCTLNTKECIKINLKNEGRCDHTYLYHIVNNYNDLADVTIFTKGSSDMQRESKKLSFTVRKVFETKNTVLSVEEHPIAIHIQAGTFKLDEYKASHPANYSGMDESTSRKMKLAPIRPFGKWFEHYFPGVNIYKAVYSGVFAISRNHIHQHPKSYYQGFIKQLEGHPNPEVGHYFERAWVALFHPIPDVFMFNSLVHESMYGGKRKARRKTGRKTRRKTRRRPDLY